MTRTTRSADRPTINDVARTAGVSLGTVSRVLNDHKSVSDELRGRVTRAIEVLGYRPDSAAQSMRRGATRAVAIVIRDITIPVFAGFVKAAQGALHEAGYALILSGSDDRRDRELELLDLVSRRRIDGLIMTTASEKDEALLRAREALRIPVVLLDRASPPHFDALLVAHREGTRKAAEYLLDLGHRRIALLTGPTTVRPAAERVRGYDDAFAARGLEVDARLVRTSGFGSDVAYREASALFGQPSPPTAFIAGGVTMLAGVLRAVRAHGLRVPDDVSIVGSCDSDLAELATPPLTVVHWSFAELGRAAAELLLDRLGRDPDRPPRHIKFPADLIIRGSCAAPRRGD